MMSLNNREIATIIWMFIISVWAISQAGIRKSIVELLKTFFQYKIIGFVCIMIIYTITIVYLLSFLGIWNVSLLKDTIVWFCLCAMAMMIRFVTSKEQYNIFRKVVAENISIAIVLEFIINAYTFSLFVELILLPFLAFIAMLDVIASSYKQYADVARFTKSLQAIAGFTILANAILHLISGMKTLGSLNTLINITSAPLLSVLFVPCIYGLVLISNYEQIFIRIDYYPEKDSKLKRYAKKQIIRNANISLRKTHELFTRSAWKLINIETRSDIDDILRSLH